MPEDASRLAPSRPGDAVQEALAAQARELEELTRLRAALDQAAGESLRLHHEVLNAIVQMRRDVERLDRALRRLAVARTG